jgi:hypothetical protein
MIHYPDGAQPSAVDGRCGRPGRVELLKKLHGHFVSYRIDVTVLDVSLDGLRIETPFVFPADAVHAFRLTLGDGSSVTVGGRVVHSMHRATADGSPCYVTGIKFLADQRESPVVDDVVGSVKRVNLPTPELALV